MEIVALYRGRGKGQNMPGSINFSEQIAYFFLAFSHQTILIPVFILGFTLHKRMVFGHAFFLLLITIIFNAVLKSIFQVPLSPSVGKEGFAFPSGHMQASVAFYGWLIYSFSSLFLRILLLLLLGSIGWSLVYFSYHNWIDILGAVTFALLTLFSYQRAIDSTVWLKKRPDFMGIALVALSAVLLTYLSYKLRIPPHTWKVFYGLAGFSLSWIFFHKSVQKKSSWRENFLALCLCTFSVVTIYLIFQWGPLKSYRQLQAFPMAFLIPLSIKLAQGGFLNVFRN
jgi:membrane-associated phospholipid phosphatase